MNDKNASTREGWEHRDVNIPQTIPNKKRLEVKVHKHIESLPFWRQWVNHLIEVTE